MAFREDAAAVGTKDLYAPWVIFWRYDHVLSLGHRNPPTQTRYVFSLSTLIPENGKALCNTAYQGHAVPSESGERMSRRVRRNHTPAFKAKVALAAIKRGTLL
jgi:hypothetical protein